MSPTCSPLRVHQQPSPILAVQPRDNLCFFAFRCSTSVQRGGMKGRKNSRRGRKKKTSGASLGRGCSPVHRMNEMAAARCTRSWSMLLGYPHARADPPSAPFASALYSSDMATLQLGQMNREWIEELQFFCFYNFFIYFLFFISVSFSPVNNDERVRRGRREGRRARGIYNRSAARTTLRLINRSVYKHTIVSIYSSVHRSVVPPL